MSSSHRAWRLHGPGGLRLDQVVSAPPPAEGVSVRVSAATVLSYTAKVLDGSLSYALPPAPFVPGTNAVGTVEDVGAGVYHLRPGMRVFVSPHLVANELSADPAQILMGLTAMGPARPIGLPEEVLAFQRRWPDGAFSERMLAPAAALTPLDTLSHVPADRLAVLAKLVVPYGGLLRSRLAAGETLIVNGATGYFGSAALLLGLAMGAGRILAVGRNQGALERVVSIGPGRIEAVALQGDAAHDAAALREAAGGGGDVVLDIVGQASSTDSSRACLHALRRGGRFVIMGSALAPLPIEFGEMLANDWEIIGQFMYPARAPAALVAMVRAGLLDLDAVRVRAFPFDQLPDAIAAATDMEPLDLVCITP